MAPLESPPKITFGPVFAMAPYFDYEILVKTLSIMHDPVCEYFEIILGIDF